MVFLNSGKINTENLYKRPGRIISVDGPRRSFSLRRWIEYFVRRTMNPVVMHMMDDMKLYLDLQHGVKYNIYADSLQASVNRLRSHVDGVKTIVAQKLSEYEERHLADRKVILKQNERIAVLEQLILPKLERTVDEVEPGGRA